MRTVIAGGRGFLGSALSARLLADGHQVVILTREAARPPTGARATWIQWQPNGETGPWAAALDGADAVINLAGESIAERRWSARRKEQIRDSRIIATRSVVAAITAAAKRPAVLVNASAVGYYSDRGDEFLTETAPPGTDFLAQVCRDWEQEAMHAAALTRVVMVRSGIVLGREGGALPKIVRPFQFFIGGPLGSGRQYMSWIHKTDWVNLACWLIRTADASGPFNATAIEPVTNAAFGRALGRVLHRPSSLPTPAFALRLVLGEMADALLLSSQRAVPARATGLGFTFGFAGLEAALASLFDR